MQQVGRQGSEGIEFRLTVWLGGETGWHARVVAPDASERVFASPFELARFVAWPAVLVANDNGKGLR